MLRPIPLVEPVTSDTFPISICPIVVIGCLMAMFMANKHPPVVAARNRLRFATAPMLPDGERTLKILIG